MTYNDVEIGIEGKMWIIGKTICIRIRSKPLSNGKFNFAYKTFCDVNTEIKECQRLCNKWTLDGAKIGGCTEHNIRCASCAIKFGGVIKKRKK